jgi:ribosomal protein S17E
MSDIVDEVLELVESYANDAASEDMADYQESKRLVAAMKTTKAKIKSRIEGLRTQLADATRKLEEVRMHTDAIDRVMLPDPQDERGVSYAWMKSEIRKRTASIRQAIEQGKGGDES